jgi:hypothetical protein
LLIELAAWQPLLFAPGTQQRHSNIEFNSPAMSSTANISPA